MKRRFVGRHLMASRKETALAILIVIAFWRSMGVFWGLLAAALGVVDRPMEWMRFGLECLMVVGLWVAYFNVKAIGETGNDE